MKYEPTSNPSSITATPSKDDHGNVVAEFFWFTSGWNARLHNMGGEPPILIDCVSRETWLAGYKASEQSLKKER